MRGTRSRRLAGESGSASVEFVLMFPVMFALFMMSFELGMLTIRQVLLDRALDLTVREVRLGTIDPVTRDALTDRLCAHASAIPDCRAQVRLEMRSVDPFAWAGIPREPDCVDREDRAQPARAFAAGRENQLMVLRAYVLFDPYFPTSLLGSALPDISDGAYGLVSTSSFVIEPLR